MPALFVSLKEISQFVAVSSAETSQPSSVRYLFSIISMIKEIISRCHFCVQHQSGLVPTKKKKKKKRYWCLFDALKRNLT